MSIYLICLYFLEDYLLEHGIVSQLTAPGTPQQNGVAERKNRTLLDMVRSMMSYSSLLPSFWGYALQTDFAPFPHMGVSGPRAKGKDQEAGIADRSVSVCGLPQRHERRSVL